MPTLLVIDDEQSVRYSSRRAFETDDTPVLTAATGAEGLELVRTQAPDVVVLDLQPDGPGLDFFRALRELGPRRPVIFRRPPETVRAPGLPDGDFLGGTCWQVPGRASAGGGGPSVVGKDAPSPP
jgi:hypothetical protein